MQSARKCFTILHQNDEEQKFQSWVSANFLYLEEWIHINDFVYQNLETFSYTSKHFINMSIQLDESQASFLCIYG